MFVSKRYHESEIRKVTNDRDLVISTIRTMYDTRIGDLQSQIADLRTLVFPKVSKTPEPMVLEADNVISASEKPFGMSEEEHHRLLEQSRETDLLFSGNYDSDLLNV